MNVICGACVNTHCYSLSLRGTRIYVLCRRVVTRYVCSVHVFVEFTVGKVSSYNGAVFT